jgi:hypothetical protein
MLVQLALVRMEMNHGLLLKMWMLLSCIHVSCSIVPILVRRYVQAYCISDIPTVPNSVIFLNTVFLFFFFFWQEYLLSNFRRLVYCRLMVNSTIMIKDVEKIACLLVKLCVLCCQHQVYLASSN